MKDTSTEALIRAVKIQTEIIQKNENRLWTMEKDMEQCGAADSREYERLKNIRQGLEKEQEAMKTRREYVSAAAICQILWDNLGLFYEKQDGKCPKKFRKFLEERYGIQINEIAEAHNLRHIAVELTAAMAAKEWPGAAAESFTIHEHENNITVTPRRLNNLFGDICSITFPEKLADDLERFSRDMKGWKKACLEAGDTDAGKEYLEYLRLKEKFKNI